ncbi:MAG: hypothetical protein GY847_17910 [Proteobacteria bacterium]|nr:hypothetical protein [Pseudomonadota bacterium]
MVNLLAILITAVFLMIPLGANASDRSADELSEDRQTVQENIEQTNQDLLLTKQRFRKKRAIGIGLMAGGFGLTGFGTLILLDAKYMFMPNTTDEDVGYGKLYGSTTVILGSGCLIAGTALFFLSNKRIKKLESQSTGHNNKIKLSNASPYYDPNSRSLGLMMSYSF